MSKGTPYERVITKIVLRDDCWIFVGYRWKNGYGGIRIGDRVVRANRVVAEHCLGPDDRDVLHSCDEPACVNPAHLRYGTHAENMADMARRLRSPTKLSIDDVAAIRIDQRAHRLIATDYGIHRSTVSRIKSGLRRQHV